MIEKREHIPVLLDCNMTEETAGILFALQRLNHVDVRGISLCFGRTSLASSHRSLSGLLYLFDWDMPAALGEERPWRRDYLLPVEETDIAEAINGLQIDTDSLCPVSDLDGADFLYRKLLEMDELNVGKVKILCAGPLTNLAVLLERHPDARGYIDEIIWCGGTQRHASLQIVKDYHTYLDPEAAQFVLEQHLNFTMCPVDAGVCSCIYQSEIDSRMRETAPILHQYNRLLKKRWCDVNAEFPIGQRTRPLPLPELAAVTALALPHLCRKEPVYGEVDLKGRLTFGMLVIDINNRLEHTQAEKNINWVTDVDREALIHRLYLD